MNISDELRAMAERIDKDRRCPTISQEISVDEVYRQLADALGHDAEFSIGFRLQRRSGKTSILFTISDKSCARYESPSLAEALRQVLLKHAPVDQANPVLSAAQAIEPLPF